jgi:hypothetical protein
MISVTVYVGQTLFDVAIQNCGSVEAAFAIAANNNIPLDYIVSENEIMLIPPPYNKTIVNYFHYNKIKPCTGVE